MKSVEKILLARAEETMRNFDWDIHAYDSHLGRKSRASRTRKNAVGENNPLKRGQGLRVGVPRQPRG
jgi:hypothetical protein